jgi:purine-binding chemotaxis protein CheW
VDPTDGDETPPDLPRTPTRPWCLFRCGRAAYAVGLEAVAEVVEVERLVRLPQSPPHVLGLCALRREVIPVVALDRPEGGPAAAFGKLPVLIVRTARGQWGVRIDAEGTAVAEEPLDPAGPADDGSGAAFVGTVRRDDTSYAALDPEATWSGLRRGIDEWYGGTPVRDAPAGADAPSPAHPAKAG